MYHVHRTQNCLDFKIEFVRIWIFESHSQLIKLWCFDFHNSSTIDAWGVKASIFDEVGSGRPPPWSIRIGWVVNSYKLDLEHNLIIELLNVSSRWMFKKRDSISRNSQLSTTTFTRLITLSCSKVRASNQKKCKCLKWMAYKININITSPFQCCMNTYTPQKTYVSS